MLISDFYEFLLTMIGRNSLSVVCQTERREAPLPGTTPTASGLVELKKSVG